MFVDSDIDSRVYCFDVVGIIFGVDLVDGKIRFSSGLPILAKKQTPPMKWRVYWSER